MEKLPRKGTLWTWTVQQFPPPHPYAGDLDNFVPFGVGYVELPEGIRVEARLSTHDPDELESLLLGMQLLLLLGAKRASGELLDKRARMGEDVSDFAGTSSSSCRGSSDK